MNGCLLAGTQIVGLRKCHPTFTQPVVLLLGGCCVMCIPIRVFKPWLDHMAYTLRCIIIAGAGVDSFYEYLFKSWLMFGDLDFLKMATQAYEAVNTHLRHGNQHTIPYRSLPAQRLQCREDDT